MTQATGGPESAADVPAAPVALREPAHRASERAVPYWRVRAAAGAAAQVALLVGIGIAVWLLAPDHLWWVCLVLLPLAAAAVARVVVMPRLRYRVHRWEVTPTAVHTRAGWLTRDERIAPLSRVQTVDSTQGPLMRAFRLGSITVTTASAAGPIRIEALDFEVARRVVAELTEVTGRDPGDAT